MPTIKDVAREAGVSIATVSYVLNNKPAAISEDTRRLVWDTARRIGYTPNVTARNLRASESRLIGYAWHEVPLDQVNPVLDRFTYFLARSAEAAGYHILTFTYPPDDPLPVYDELIRTGRVDGFVVGGTNLDDPRLEYLIQRQFPFVAFGRSNPNWDFCWVDTDGQQGVRDAVDYLVEQGHRRIAIAAWPDESLAGKFRLLGYLTGLEAAGIASRPEWIFRAEHSEISGREALAYWWSLPAELRPTAVVAVSDLMAIGVMNEAERLGLRVGHDLSVIGFDDAPMSQYLRPSLSTLRQPIPEIAERVVQILEALLLERSGQPAAVTFERQVLLPPELIIRDSCGPAPHP